MDDGGTGDGRVTDILRDTPYLAVDLAILERNLERAAADASAHGLALRPHAKTHKIPQIARMQLALGAGGLTLATVSEAEVFADAGIEDIFIAYPVWPSAARAARIRRLSERAALRLGVDSIESALALGAALPRDTVEVLVEVDSGHHRSGVQPALAGSVAAAAQSAGLRVLGVFTFPGHSYAPGAGARAAADEAAAILAATESLEKERIDATVRSGGSTPSRTATDGSTLTEVRPGVYVFNDAQQVELGSCGFEDVALTAVATIVSRNGRDVIADAGSKVLGADRAAWATGFGRLLDVPGARITALSEHHATIRMPDDVSLPDLGSAVRIVPNHVCATMNLADDVAVLRDGEIVDSWAIAARGANT
ncbi:D-serine deaminase-like pyridoxal phosphate-dependent protein [Cryobacterium mesophilum]|uniref:alanine racemase n=1 Tax=Terrimesophilobacter mesophilus TaxID=433647 RepID=UPI0017B497C9|nr:alanine racemase [Terrimesophilobacter mesophilus]MBB5632426.1 D-serine deaminase-like pyridoxal phosphate-dependent protein [Terrimesophilobacter mesophilus]